MHNAMFPQPNMKETVAIHPWQLACTILSSQQSRCAVYVPFQPRTHAGFPQFAVEACMVQGYSSLPPMCFLRMP